MKKIFTLLTIVLAASNLSMAQWVQCDSSIFGIKVTSLLAVGNDFLATSGSNRVSVSHDNGATWAPSNTGLGSTSYWALATNGTNTYTGSDAGVFSSPDNGANWVSKGLASASIYALAVNGDTVIAGSYGGGIYYSNNAGTTWATVSLTASTQNITSLAICGSTFFAGTYNGIYSSSNYGVSWTLATGIPTNPSVHALITVGNNVYAGTHGSGIFLSTDKGATWNAVNNGLNYTYITSLASNGTVIVAGTNYYGAYYSIDGGANWSDISFNLPNTDFLSAAIGSTHAILGTNDSERTWSTPFAQLLSGVKANDAKRNVSIYPNPVKNQLNIELADFVNATATIYSVDGKLIETNLFTENKTTINTQNLNSGVYYLLVKNNATVSTFKFIKE